MKLKNNRGSIVITVILIIIIIALGAYIVYDKFIVNDKCEKETVEVENKDKDYKDNVIVKDRDYIPYKDGKINVYAIGDSALVFGTNKSLYLADLASAASGLFDNITNTENKEFSIYADEESKAKIVNLGASEDEIKRVKIYHDVLSKDPTYNVYLIYKNGSVKMLTVRDEVGALKSILSEYKVTDLEEVCGDSNCSHASYKLTLSDGSTKTISK